MARPNKEARSNHGEGDVGKRSSLPIAMVPRTEGQVTSFETVPQLNGAEEDASVCATIRRAEPDVLLIIHKAGPEYLALVPANDQRIFVHEQTWTRDGLKKMLTWQTPRRPSKGIRTLYSSPSWHTWTLGVDRAKYLSDPEYRELAEETIQRLKNDAAKSAHGDQLCAPLIASVHWEQTLGILVQRSHALIPKENLLTAPRQGPKITRVSVRWGRSPLSRRVSLAEYNETPADLRRECLPWEGTGRSLPIAPSAIWHCDDDVYDAFLTEWNAYSRFLLDQQALRQRVDRAWSRLVDQFRHAAPAPTVPILSRRPDLKGAIAVEPPAPQLRDLNLYRALEVCVERNIPLTGRTVDDIVATARNILGQALNVRDDVRGLKLD